MKIRTDIEVNKKDFYKTMFELSLHHRMELDYEDAMQYISAIGYYNDFDWHNVAQSLQEVELHIPTADYGKDNPNNGKRIFTISVGRESSPVVYLELHSYQKGYNEAKENAEAICKIMQNGAKADESDFEIEKTSLGETLTFRFWWD